jgi:light-regulated signal transduction histidine kinase (bacteriophytochrome)
VLNANLSLHAAELAATNKELAAFSYSASHDLSKPLTRIYGAGQALEEYAHLLDDNGRYFIKTIIDAARQMEELIDALLMLSRVTQREMSHGDVDLSLLATMTIAELRQCDPERTVDVIIAPDLVASGDEQLLGIALDNLLGNAWKYTIKSSAPVIEFGCRNRDKELVYFVRDTGIGFETKHADRIFKPFQRLHGSDEFPGTGIGLATVQRVIERHRGKVWGEGEPGKGATIFFTLNS